MSLVLLPLVGCTSVSPNYGRDVVVSDTVDVTVQDVPRDVVFLLPDVQRDIVELVSDTTMDAPDAQTGTDVQAAADVPPQDAGLWLGSRPSDRVFGGAFRSTCHQDMFGCVEANMDRVYSGVGTVPSTCLQSSVSIGFLVWYCPQGAVSSSVCKKVEGSILLTSNGGYTISRISVGGADTTDATLEYTREYADGATTRRNFHLKFRLDPNFMHAGATGIPGVTDDPAYGDLWALGCPLP